MTTTGTDIATEFEAVTPEASSPPEQPPRLPAWVLRISGLTDNGAALVWAGVVLVGAGFGLLAITWWKVSGTTDVARQMPYFISGGLVAVCIVLCGVSIARVGADRRDSVEQVRQLERLRATLEELRTAVEAATNAGAPRATRRGSDGVASGTQVNREGRARR